MENIDNKFSKILENNNQDTQSESNHDLILLSEPSLNDILNKVNKTDVDLKKENEIKFTEEENKVINALKEQIDINKREDIINYGTDAQVKMTNFSQETLDKVKNKDLDDVGKLLGNVVNELKSFDTSGNKKGIVAFFKRKANKITEIQTKYESVASNVDGIVKNLVDHQKNLVNDINNLDNMYDINRKYYRDLSLYIEAGKKKIESVKNDELVKLTDKVNEFHNPEDIQELKDLNDNISKFEKKIHDLDLTRSISLQMAPQIRMIQNANGVMVEKIQSTIINTIPLWKSQLVLAIGAKNTSQVADAQKKVTDLTNELLKKNADALKMATIDTAKASEESIISTETIKYTNDRLIEALNEVKTIQLEGIKQRETASGELRKLESELKSNLIQLSLESTKDRVAIDNK